MFSSFICAFHGGLGVQATIRWSFLSHFCVNDVGADRPPDLVPALVREFGAFQDREVLLEARSCDGEDAVRLSGYLRDPQRTVPVLVVSPAARGRTLVSTGQLTLKLAGLAHVYTLSSDLATRRFCSEVGKRFECLGGAVRLYRPLLREADPAERHPIWTPNFLTGNDRDYFLLQVMLELLERGSGSEEGKQASTPGAGHRAVEPGTGKGAS